MTLDEFLALPDDELTAEPRLPGFRVLVRTFFE